MTLATIHNEVIQGVSQTLLKMNPFKNIAFLLLLAAFILSNSSCTVVKQDNGEHKGWYKNTNNPHNPNSPNPGKGNGNNKKQLVLTGGWSHVGFCLFTLLGRPKYYLHVKEKTVY